MKSTSRFATFAAALLLAALPLTAASANHVADITTMLSGT